MSPETRTRLQLILLAPSELERAEDQRGDVVGYTTREGALDGDPLYSVILADRPEAKAAFAELYATFIVDWEIGIVKGRASGARTRLAWAVAHEDTIVVTRPDTHSKAVQLAQRYAASMAPARDSSLYNHVGLTWAPGLTFVDAVWAGLQATPTRTSRRPNRSVGRQITLPHTAVLGPKGKVSVYIS
jgi:hypothetical protein